MKDPVQIVFRGVCLYVAEGGGLTVLFPTTDGHKLDCMTPGKHYPIFTCFEGNTLVGKPEEFGGLDLRIVAGGDTTLVVHGGMLNLGTIVNKYKETKLLDEREVDHDPDRLSATAILKGGGIAIPATPTMYSFVVDDTLGETKYLSYYPRLELVWTALNDENVKVTGLQSGTLDLSPGMVAVIGHYDNKDDAQHREIKPRPCSDRIPRDVDFIFLYRLLYDLPEKELPIPKQGRDPAPLTSTCFGATWPDQ